MTQVTVTKVASHFCSFVEQLIIRELNDVVWSERSRKARPTRTGFVFVLGAEQHFAGDDVDVDPILVIVPVLVMERRLSSLVLRDVILERGKLCAQFGVGGFTKRRSK